MTEHKIDSCGTPWKTEKIKLEGVTAIRTLSLFSLKLFIYYIWFKIVKFPKVSTL